MNEVYWIAGAEMNTLPEQLTPPSNGQEADVLLGKLLKASGVKPGWVDEIHWYSDPVVDNLPQELILGEEFPCDIPTFGWAAQKGLDYYLFHSIVRAILAGDNHLVCFGQKEGSNISAMLLASPTAVGRYNLIPQGCLAIRLVFPANLSQKSKVFMQILRDRLTKNEIDPEKVTYLAMPGYDRPEENDIRQLFPEVTYIANDPEKPSGAVYQVNKLVRSLDTCKGCCGLLSGISQGRAILSTLIEKV
jgi:hypothetical protein